MVPQEFEIRTWPLIEADRSLSTALTATIVAGRILNGGFSDSVEYRLEHRKQAERFASDIIARESREVIIMARETAPDVDISEGNFWLLNANGKENYLRDIPVCDFSIAQVERGSIRLGVVYDFLHGEIYYAVEGSGTYKNGQRIHVSNRDFEQSTISFAPLAYRASPKGEHEQEEVGVLWAGMKDISFDSGRHHREFQSGGLELAWVACGRLDGYASSWTDLWNLAAGRLLVTEAEGIATDIFGRLWQPGYDGVIAGNSKVQPEMLSRFQGYFQKR